MGSHIQDLRHNLVTQVSYDMTIVRCIDHQLRWLKHTLSLMHMEDPFNEVFIGRNLPLVGHPGRVTGLGPTIVSKKKYIPRCQQNTLQNFISQRRTQRKLSLVPSQHPQGLAPEGPSPVMAKLQVLISWELYTMAPNTSLGQNGTHVAQP